MFVCQVIWGYILDVLNTTLVESMSCLNTMEKVIYLFCKQAINPVGFRPQVSPSLLSVMVSMSVPLSKPVQWYLDIFLYGPLSDQCRTCAIIYSLVQFSKSLVCVYDEIHIRHSKVNLGVHKYLYRAIFQSFSLSGVFLVFFQFPKTPLFGPPAEKLRL